MSRVTSILLLIWAALTYGKDISCQVQPVWEIATDKQIPRHFYECRLPEYGVIELDIPVSQIDYDALEEGAWNINFPSEWVSREQSLSPKLHVPQGQSIRTITPNLRSRRLPAPQRKVLSETTLVVLVNAEDTHCGLSAQQASDIVFAEKDSANTLYSSCTDSRLNILGRGNGVISVFLSENLNSFTKTTIKSAAIASVCEYYGLDASCDPVKSKALDHILFVIPEGLSEDSQGWIRGDIGGHYSLYQEAVFAPESIMHQLQQNCKTA